MYKYAFIFSVFFLTACGNKVSFLPEGDYLNDAQIGKPYYSVVDIHGGRVIKPNNSMIPDNLGLYIQQCELPEDIITEDTVSTKDFNCFIVKGIPIKAGNLKVNVSGAVYGNMFKSPTKFNKTYSIRIKE
ncbi:hypothetical protein Xbed_03579 [Xenorhabdus beddingii]|uniref:Lipoprotein n=1 Tax=Xenorhabdus beddingii TaxID=40578 RepID=A0A1Y2SCE6_9GAMM|nr:hypothetical protein [Xenorhabdus beddingii]OTA15631.1 hypothetical protein Xbed_03579 [Xenorhabdus beddingii]